MHMTRSTTVCDRRTGSMDSGGFVAVAGWASVDSWWQWRCIVRFLHLLLSNFFIPFGACSWAPKFDDDLSQEWRFVLKARGMELFLSRSHPFFLSMGYNFSVILLKYSTVGWHGTIRAGGGSTFCL